MKKVVVVLMGGWSGERDVSLTSGREVVKALQDSPYIVHALDVTQDILSWLPQLLSYKPDVIFMNALHGRFVEDGCLQGLIEMLGIPYTNSGVLSSALAMDKGWSRRLFQQAGLSIPEGAEMTVAQLTSQMPLDLPFVIKPTDEGSSLGVTIVKRQEDWDRALSTWAYGPKAMVEQYIPGKELSVAIAYGKALGILELEALTDFYNYEAKYTDGVTRHHMPARICEEAAQEVMALAEEAVKALGCQGVCRVDIRFDDVTQAPGKPYVLEVNTLPGLTPLSIVPEIAAYQGITFLDLLIHMIENPLCPRKVLPLDGNVSRHAAA
jgi:D-alanine-D-alanine ligase